MSEPEERFPINSLVVAMTDEDAFAVEKLVVGFTESEVCGVVFYRLGESHGESAGWVDGAEEDVDQAMADFLAAVPGVDEGFGVVDPGHLDWTSSLCHHDLQRVLSESSCLRMDRE